MADKQQAKNAPIQFRPGGSLARLLGEHALRWRISENEAARRLTALAACQLDASYHDMVVEMERQLGGLHAFEDACANSITALESANRTRVGLGTTALDDSGRRKFVVETVRQFLRVRRQRAEEQEAEQQIYLHERLDG